MLTKKASSQGGLLCLLETQADAWDWGTARSLAHCRRMSQSHLGGREWASWSVLCFGWPSHCFQNAQATPSRLQSKQTEFRHSEQEGCLGTFLVCVTPWHVGRGTRGFKARAKIHFPFPAACSQEGTRHDPSHDTLGLLLATSFFLWGRFLHLSLYSLVAT